MRGKQNLERTLSFCVPAGFTAELEQARRALGFRSHSDVIRAALVEHLSKKRRKNMTGNDGERKATAACSRHAAAVGLGACGERPGHIQAAVEIR